MAKQTQVPVSQTVKPVRQPRGPPSSLQMEEGIENYNLTQYLHGLDDNEDGEGEYNEEENRWHAPSQSEKKLQCKKICRPKGALLCNKSNHSHKAQEEINEWFSSIQYLHSTINDLTISNSFLDPGSEFGAVNDATIKALEWENDKQSDFAIKSDNSKHITKSLGWIIDVPVSIKDKAEKTVTVSGNFARINNGEPEPMLCLGMTWIRKVQGILDPNRNQFRMKLHGKTYTIPTFSKALKVSELEQQVSDMHHGKDLKKNA
ncbi:15614_t:CDS:2 [Gigaspora rosea]|nr:15614_t:CDS:2 [Gigaspora rosea]